MCARPRPNELTHLANDGDGREKDARTKFLASDFPSYADFWFDFIRPLTNRPANVGFKTDAELRALDYGAQNVCIAQLHYSVVNHLLIAHALKAVPNLDLNSLAHCIIRLVAALDVAEEMLQRHATTRADLNSVKYDAWDEDRGQAARRTWQTNHPADRIRFKPLRKYRNHLIHGRVGMTVAGADLVSKVPRIGQESLYLDWRKAILLLQADALKLAQDFDTPKNIANQSWQDVLSYLEREWQASL